jgi:hypothetical protein
MNWLLQSYFAGIREIETEKDTEVEELESLVAPFQVDLQISLVCLMRKPRRVAVTAMLGGMGLDVCDEE